jgi:predicted GIY-YIG superfamily endonuclease
MSWYVYFLKSKNEYWYYVGSTNRLVKRTGEHNSGKVTSTKLHRPLELVYSQCFQNEKEARNYEHKIKKMRREKERIISIIENKK